MGRWLSPPDLGSQLVLRSCRKACRETACEHKVSRINKPELASNGSNNTQFKGILAPGYNSPLPFDPSFATSIAMRVGIRSEGIPETGLHVRIAARIPMAPASSANTVAVPDMPRRSVSGGRSPGTTSLGQPNGYGSFQLIQYAQTKTDTHVEGIRIQHAVAHKRRAKDPDPIGEHCANLQLKRLREVVVVLVVDAVRPAPSLPQSCGVSSAPLGIVSDTR